ncbi:hypothetical protein JTB14_001243 [Gonioctena quinquepunctata]|nr:hypothetical protein JTB14_001243 [Gonioctena quinquepunctata]
MVTHKSSASLYYFKGKNIFITGGSGFIGKVLIEKILRSCPGVGNIYVLLRDRKGKSIEERLAIIKNIVLFDPLRKSNPDSLKKLIPINGDVSNLRLEVPTQHHNLGINPVRGTHKHHNLRNKPVPRYPHNTTTSRINPARSKQHNLRNKPVEVLHQHHNLRNKPRRGTHTTHHNLRNEPRRGTHTTHTSEKPRRGYPHTHHNLRNKPLRVYSHNTTISVINPVEVPKNTTTSG